MHNSGKSMEIPVSTYNVNYDMTVKTDVQNGFPLKKQQIYLITE
jgi:hypothetical protein